MPHPSQATGSPARENQTAGASQRQAWPSGSSPRREIKHINLTPHPVRLNDGREFPPSGVVARVAATYTPFDENWVCRAVFGPVQNLPDPQPGVIYIVSALVAQAAKRADVVSPATGHPLARRDQNGQIISVPGFVRAT